MSDYERIKTVLKTSIQNHLGQGGMVYLLAEWGMGDSESSHGKRGNCTADPTGNSLKCASERQVVKSQDNGEVDLFPLSNQVS